MQSVLCLLLLGPAFVGGQECIDGTGAESFDMYMPYHNKMVTVPPINQTVAAYAYAGDKALVAVPAKCYEQYQAQLGFTSNIDDRQPGGPTGMFYFRISDPETEYAMLAQMGSTCSCGLVILVHGTSGVRWQSASYAIAMAGMGYVVVVPDSHAMPAEMGLKGVDKLKKTADIATTNYCGALDAYKERCSSWEHAFCYSTKTANVLNDASKYREYVERNYLIRKLELDSFVGKRQALLSAFSKVFLFGRSEGAMTAARYYHADLHPHLAGLVLSGWSCEFNYFMSCAAHARVCGDMCDKTIPVLNVNGGKDSYFSADPSSVSSIVAANATHGYGGDITGNCRASFNAQSFTKSTVVAFPGVSHSIMYSHDNALRSIMADFLADPESSSAEWGSLKRTGCTMTNGVYECDADSGDQSPCVSYVTNPAAPWSFRGKRETCAMDSKTCGDVKKSYKAASCCGSPDKLFETAKGGRRLETAPATARSATLQEEIANLLKADLED